MDKKYSLYFHTVRYLHPKQIFYRLYYHFKNKLQKRLQIILRYLKKQKDFSVAELKLKPTIAYPKVFENSELKLLNKSISLANLTAVDWNEKAYGKLFTYHLNYFDWIHQENISLEAIVLQMKAYESSREKLVDGYESYPISLRLVNWIKYLSLNREVIRSFDSDFLERMDVFMFAQLQLLSKNLEYHLMANHLLENAFALLWGSYYFQKESFYKLASQILFKELEEQVLLDGMHFELSPAYHCLMLFRVLDALNLISGNPWQADRLEMTLKDKAAIMLRWLERFTFSDGKLPLLGDSSGDYFPKANELFAYAERLKINPLKGPMFSPLNRYLGLFDSMSSFLSSGYRKIQKGSFELLIDVGPVGPDYQPGHAHCDCLSFLLYHHGKSIFTETGVSTYQEGERRMYERSTQAHNTVCLEGQEQSEIWGSFRTARRAYGLIHVDITSELKASHTGFHAVDATHYRQFNWSEKQIRLQDTIKGKEASIPAKAYFHLAPGISPELSQASLLKIGLLEIQFENATQFVVEDYYCAIGFNNLVSAKRIVVSFEKNLVTVIREKQS